MFNFLKDFIFPRRCLGCGQWGEYLCSDCLNLIKTCDERICPMCGRPSLGGLTHPVCHQPLSLDGLTSIFIYQGIIKRAIIKLKYKFVTDLAETIVELFLSFCGEDKAFSQVAKQKNVFLVPIPLYWQRKNWRGFNQTELLGKIISAKLGIGFLPDLLVRKRKTKSQTKLSRAYRQKNILGAFKINQKFKVGTSSQLKYSKIILFDDVWTSGATMREGAKVLKRNNFNKVWGLTLAR